MTSGPKTRSATARERLDHPVIDGDGHIVELMPLVFDYLQEIGGKKLLERYVAALQRPWYEMSRHQRRENRLVRPPFWALSPNALDRATVTLPNLFRERMDELGIDFAVLYTSFGLNMLQTQDDELRRAGCRALNTMYADMFSAHADRMTVPAVIPMNTPEEALDELDYAVNRLGMKAITVGTSIRRPIPAAATSPEASRYATWWDVLAYGSDYDYDAVWQKCIDLRVVPTTHDRSINWGARTSPENHCFNHIGHFAAAGEAFCKGLVFGGVPRRFPALKFAFLEGGVAWACSLYNDLIVHWEKRNIDALHRNLDPSKLDLEAFNELFQKYGGTLAQRRPDAVSGRPNGSFLRPRVESPADLDEWSSAGIEEARDFAEIFDNFFFGCEGDDRMSAVAFNPKLNAFGSKMHAFFGSDIGHWDVTDITATVAEAYELVEDELLTDADFRDFTFANVVRMYTSMNPDFFRGTAVESAARDVIPVRHT